MWENQLWKESGMSPEEAEKILDELEQSGDLQLDGKLLFLYLFISVYIVK